MESLRCVVVDDEPFAREGIVSYINKIDFLDLIAECEDAIALNVVLKKDKIDLIFLDIEMPEITGLDYIASLTNPPKIIIISAYEQYALRGYELEVIDYLLKPVSFERFFKAVNKAFDNLEKERLQHSFKTSSIESDHIFVKVDKVLKKVWFSDILFIQALGNYAVIHTTCGQEITYRSLQQFVGQLPVDGFLTCHRSYVVNKHKVEAIEGNQLCIGKHKIPIARNLKEEVLSIILGNT